jgi:hypothetical protein
MANKSGRFIVRVPIWLHETLADQAKDQNVSMNSYINSILAGTAGKRSTPGAYPPWQPSNPISSGSGYARKTLKPIKSMTGQTFEVKQPGGYAVRTLVLDDVSVDFGEFVEGIEMSGAGTQDDPIQVKLRKLHSDMGGEYEIVEEKDNE